MTTNTPESNLEASTGILDNAPDCLDCLSKVYDLARHSKSHANMITLHESISKEIEGKRNAGMEDASLLETLATHDSTIHASQFDIDIQMEKDSMKDVMEDANE